MSIRAYEASEFYPESALNITFDGNEVFFNNTQHSTNSSMEGGVSISKTGNVNIMGNYVHNNYTNTSPVDGH